MTPTKSFVTPSKFAASYERAVNSTVPAIVSHALRHLDLNASFYAKAA